MGVSSKNRGTPKWMVYFMENPIKMDDLGGKTYFWVDTHIMSDPATPAKVFLLGKRKQQVTSG